MEKKRRIGIDITDITDKNFVTHEFERSNKCSLQIWAKYVQIDKISIDLSLCLIIAHKLSCDWKRKDQSNQIILKNFLRLNQLNIEEN